ncbi:hypothetical protein J7J37_00025 [bacterium]|nr:hypothetical protein [bacterium]
MQEELKNIIEKSNLTQEQKNLWFEAIEYFTEDQISALLEVLKESPQSLNFLTENLEKKKEVFRTKDEKLKEEILKEEKEYLQQNF